MGEWKVGVADMVTPTVPNFKFKSEVIQKC